MTTNPDRPRGMQGRALEIFEGLASSYETALDIATVSQDRYWKRWVLEKLGPGDGRRLLDIGCGTCLLEEKLVTKGYSVVGLDLTEEMVRIGKSKEIAIVEGLMVGDAESLPFPDESFDAVVSCYVPKYVDLGNFAREVSRVLEKDGRVVLYDFVRPGGPASPILRLYLHGVIQVTGYLLGLARNPAADVFRNLPRIVEGATWNHSISSCFADAGVQTLVNKTLSAGIVGVFVGVKEREA